MKSKLFLFLVIMLVLALWYKFASRFNGKPAYVPNTGRPGDAPIVAAQAVYTLHLQPAERMGALTNLAQWVSQINASEAEQRDFKQALQVMTDQELVDTSTYVFDYVVKGRQLTDPALKARIDAISSRYNIFS